VDNEQAIIPCAVPVTTIKTRVVITGLGIVSPIGIGVDAFWKAALAGRSGVSFLSDVEGFAVGRYRSRVAARVKDFVPSEHLDASTADRLDRHAQFALVAAQEAVRDADLQIDRERAERVGVVVGAGMGAMTMGERELTKLYDGRRPDRVHPNFIPTITLNSASGLVALTHRAKGPNLTISTACSSSAHAIGVALGFLRAGQADAVIMVGAEASITPLAFAGFASLRALSTSFNDAPERASRPFDRARDGFVMGEGAAALILETLPHARRRKARIYAEVAGYAATSEAYHMVIPQEDGLESARTMQLALDDAAIPPARVDYINAHATATPVGDPVEIRAIRRVLKGRAERVLIAATKSLVGHTLGAAGALGAVACALSLTTGQVHPTINYDDPDPECALPGISSQMQERPVAVALLNAFGFGSNNASLVLTAFSERVRP
jgi:3-oxoacyl-[acyl-carrier-protein] synthase II